MKTKKILCVVLMLLMLLGLAGCAEREEPGSLENSETQESVMLGSVQGTVSDAEPYGYFMTTDVLYYIQAIYNEEGLAGKEIYRKKGEETEEKLAEFIGPKQALFHYFADSGGAIYYLYGEMEDKTEETIDYKMYLRKDDSTGFTRYCNVVDSVELVKSEDTLQKIDMTTGALSQKEELPFQAEEILNVFSGYENGILITTDQSLYRYIPSKGEEHLLDWGTENIHLSGEDVVQVCLDEDSYQVLQRTRNTKKCVWDDVI